MADEGEAAVGEHCDDVGDRPGGDVHVVIVWDVIVGVA